MSGIIAESRFGTFCGLSLPPPPHNLVYVHSREWTHLLTVVFIRGSNIAMFVAAFNTHNSLPLSSYILHNGVTCVCVRVSARARACIMYVCIYVCTYVCVCVYFERNTTGLNENICMLPNAEGVSNPTWWSANSCAPRELSLDVLYTWIARQWRSYRTGMSSTTIDLGPNFV
jgi:hypothetical protein